MSDPGSSKPTLAEPTRTSALPSWRKIGEFALGLLHLQKSVKSLEEQNIDLRRQVERLQGAVDKQSGQIQVLLELIDSTVQDRAAHHAEKAAMRLVQQLLALRDGPRGD